ncbi:hypothetical protein AALP_AA6G214900 [Arabis alpina]|uniref:Knottin scorpion toxin-like domain-containing protein n=1 Tax=Arabis alpina TaxID=50452 RepID=A0A087GQT2_ARAAL|nr:hypothetical protein AALP_AA6G214900 [Arabis alpina]
MSSSRFAILCIILVVFSSLHECVNGQRIAIRKRNVSICVRHKAEYLAGFVYCCTPQVYPCFSTEETCREQCQLRGP